jgi:hypothetical protein
MKKIKLKVLAGSFEINYFEILPVTLFKDPKAAKLTLKLLTRSRL